MLQASGQERGRRREKEKQKWRQALITPRAVFGQWLLGHESLS